MRYFYIIIFSTALITGFSLFCYSQNDSLYLSVNDSLLAISGDSATVQDQNLLDLDFELIVSAEKGEDSLVLDLLKKGASVNAATNEGVTALMYAAQNGHLQSVKILVLNGAGINASPDNGMTALHSVVLHNDYDITAYLLKKGASPDKGDEYGSTPLMYAAAYNFRDIAELLLRYKANVTVKDHEGASALMYAVIKGNSDIAGMLIRKGAEIDEADYSGYTALNFASQEGDIKMVTWLVEKGAKLNAGNTVSPLSVATVNGQIETAKSLIEKGADLKERISTSQNLRSLAVRHHQKEIKNLYRQLGVPVNFYPTFTGLLFGADVNWNLDDVMVGIKTGLREEKYGMNLSLGFSMRPRAKQILLYRDDEDIYYQFWEKRYYLFLDIQKKIRLNPVTEKKQWGLLAGVKGCYSFANYRASKSEVANVMNLIPCAGFYRRSKHAGISLTYEYVDLNTYELSPHRINLSFYFFINTDKHQFVKRSKEWL